MLVASLHGLPGYAEDGQTPESAKSTDLWAQRILAKDFAEVQKLIKPQPGESRWMEVPWLTTLWEARQAAAEEGKPIFVWYGSGGSPACHT
jgi:hypothetical protein